ncbi:HPP family protein [Salarchaeum sp. JOR-1]|uniref:CBS domain-containing protein n=1 Tax=Salarchaeum sp. JOR-1 TaxID=2599399 RepID=UPI001198C2C0|nr:CBS domain-containing protein [Salarchaeum sp. JOR-1]QDX41767.1 CBS domain-containing protein [Salarchaeum sp. JOR-1]
MTLLARDVMTADVETVDADDEVADVLGKLSRRKFNGFPVLEDGELVGVVTQRDFVDLFEPSDRTLWIPVGLPPFLETVEYAIDLSWDELDAELDLAAAAGKAVREVMTRDVETVSPDASIDDVLDILASDDPNVNRVPVLDDGDIVGIITREDVVRALRDERASKP